MQNKNAFIAELKKILSEPQVMLDEPMKNHTTFKIGGPADCLIFPSSLEEVRLVFKLIRTFEMPVTVIGNGSNVLVLDKGVRGVVVKFNSNLS